VNLVKIRLETKTFVSLAAASSEGYRHPTNSEKIEINRILTYLGKVGTDPNVLDVVLKNDLTQREILMFLSTGSPEIINFLGILLAYSNETVSLNAEDRYSIILFLIQRYPEVLKTALTEFGLTIYEDISDILRNIRIRVIYKKRPKRTQRIRGYRDKGNLPSQQAIYRRQLNFDEAAEEAKYLLRHDRQASDTLDFIFGLIS
jgi:hypothetical protein